MDKPNDENIRVYERACRVGGPLRLLSVYSTIRQPARRNLGTPCVTTKKQSKESPNISSSQSHIHLQNAQIDSNPAAPVKNLQMDKNLLCHPVISETVIDSIRELDVKKTKFATILDDNFSLNMSEPATSNLPIDLVDSNAPIVSIHETISKTGTPPESLSTEESEVTPLNYCQDFDVFELEPICAKQPSQSYNDNSLPFAPQLQVNSSTVTPNIFSPPYEKASIAHFKSTPEKTQLTKLPVVGTEEINMSLNNPTVAQLSLPNSSKNTPSKKRLFATCISSANRSPHKGPPGSISQSPTIQLGKKIFHVPGTILLGAPTTSPKVVKKKQAQSRRSRNKGVKFDSDCDLTLAETSDPYAFVLQKRAPKPFPASAQDLADILLKPSTPNENILLDDDDDDILPNHLNPTSRSVPRTPLRHASRFSQGPFSSSPLRNSIAAQAISNPPEALQDLSLMLSDLSTNEIPKLVVLDSLPAPSNDKAPTAPAVLPAEPFGLLPAFGEEHEKSLLNLSQESSLDVQAFLENDLGIFAGMHDF